jgi:hypothetical protein
MAASKKTSPKTAPKYINNQAVENIGDLIKGEVVKPGPADKKAKHQLQKTEEERATFIKSFAEIVKANVSVKDNYLITFADVDFATQFYITDKDKKSMDFGKLLSKSEFSAYNNLVTEWEK